MDPNTPCEWMAHDTQYAILIYSLGIEYSLHPVEVTEEIGKMDGVTHHDKRKPR